ncbi:MAG: Maf family nucleotide pyrophosphatase [Bacteroidota bacterium]
MKRSTDFGLILGSQSPRRQALLQEAGFDFEVKKMDVDESFSETMNPLEVAAYLAKEKSRAYLQSFAGHTILTADTVVIQNEHILGKPKDREQAKEMLERISGNIHQVVTGVCISNAIKTDVFHSITEVKTKALTHEEIDYYIDRYQPFDKAGAYGIQEWFGLVAIEWINGSFYNVVGLPIHLVYQSLVEKFGITPY